MSAREAFSIAEFESLLPSVYLMDDEGKNRIMEFVRDHCASRPGMMQLLICTAEMCASIARMIAVRDGKDFDFVALEVAEDTPSEMVTFGQVIAVTMNGDADTQVALLRAMLDRAEESDDGFELAAVTAETFGLFSFLMREMAGHVPEVSGDAT